MVAQFDSVFINQLGAFLPGPAISNDQIDDYIEPLNRLSQRIKRKILKENGIQTRHYALDSQGQSQYSTTQMATYAIQVCLERARVPLSDISLLCTGTSGPDAAIPGFANMVQGELGAPPMETSSHQGVCVAGMTALKYAAMALHGGWHKKALVAVSEFPSRLFKRTRFASRNYNTDFDSHFLRWMLSDGAGALLLSDQPNERGLSLQLKWLHLKSFSGDYPVCMQIGYPEQNRPKSYLDYPSFSDAEKEGALLLRQDVRVLPHLFDIGVHEYMRLVQEGYIQSDQVDHFLCHYSSEKFGPVIEDLLRKAGMEIPTDRWFSNLKTCGNTGAASIFIMLEEFFRTRALKPGQKIFCFIPESGRFTVGYMLLEVVQARPRSAGEVVSGVALPDAPAQAHAVDDPRLAGLLRQLGVVWHDFRSRFFRTPFVQKIIQRKATREDYLQWMSHWIPQVRQGSQWMRTAIQHVEEPYLLLKDMIEHHAAQEQFDFKVLFEDYRAAGGPVASIDDLKRNIGGEALNAFMYHRASQTNAVDLLGGIYIIEGTGSQIIPTLLPLLKQQLPFSDGEFKFLRYHGENDENHVREWIATVAYVLAQSPDPQIAEKIIETARITANLYLMQMENIL